LDPRAYPPRERKELHETEKARIRQGYKQLAKYEELFKPAVAALTTRGPGRCYVPGVLVDAAADPDVFVRLDVRSTFHELARARRFLEELRKRLPEIDRDGEKLDKPKEDKEKKKDDVRMKPGKPGLLQVSAVEVGEIPVHRLPPPQTRGAIQAKDDKKEEKLGKPGDEPDDEVDPNPYKGVKVDRDAIGKALVEIGEEVVRRGSLDPNAAGRRASLEGVEALGESGMVFIPQMVRSLKDPDRFVRWIAARALGRLAEPATKAKDKQYARLIVPALVCLLNEVDLDVRVAGIEAIGLYNSSAACAVPALAQHLNKGDAESRFAVMQALEKIGMEAASALPAVKPLLTNSDPRLRAEAAWLFGRFGSAASAYLPDLRRLLQDPDSEVRRAASVAIVSITDR
jgi:hypothetical protein